MTDLEFFRYAAAKEQVDVDELRRMVSFLKRLEWQELVDGLSKEEWLDIFQVRVVLAYASLT